MPNSSLDTFTLRMVARKVSPFRRAEWMWVHDHHQNHHEQHVWSPPIIITITTIIIISGMKVQNVQRRLTVLAMLLTLLTLLKRSVSRLIG